MSILPPPCSLLATKRAHKNKQSQYISSNAQKQWVSGFSDKEITEIYCFGNLELSIKIGPEIGCHFCYKTIREPLANDTGWGALRMDMEFDRKRNGNVYRVFLRSVQKPGNGALFRDMVFQYVGFM